MRQGNNLRCCIISCQTCDVKVIIHAVVQVVVNAYRLSIKIKPLARLLDVFLDVDIKVILLCSYYCLW